MRILASALVCLFMATPLWSQVGGRLAGYVTDPNGKLVPAAAVDLTLTGGTDSVLRTVTTAAGLFQFNDVRPESYDLTVHAMGFQDYTLRGVKVDPARETTISPISLVIQTVTTRVDVIAPLESVQTG